MEHMRSKGLVDSNRADKTYVQHVYNCSSCDVWMSLEIPKRTVAPAQTERAAPTMPQESRLKSLENRITFNEVGAQRNKRTPGAHKFHMVRGLPQQISNPAAALNEIENTEREQQDKISDSPEDLEADTQTPHS